MSGAAGVPRKSILGASLATAVVVVSFWSVVFSIASSAEGGEVSGSWALGVALIPFAYLAAAFGSGNPRASGAVVWALVISLGVGASLLLLDPATALIGAYAAGATVTICESETSSVKRRLWFAVAVAVFAALSIRFVPVLGLTVAPGLPFTAPLLADRTA
jgi:hypothetical protein